MTLLTNASGLPIRDPRMTCRMSNAGAPAGTVPAVIDKAEVAGE